MRWMPACSKAGPIRTTAAIIDKLSSTGVAAGTANRFQVLSTPADSDTSEMKPM